MESKLSLNEIICVAKFLKISQILKLGQTCKKISRILESELLWKQICDREYGKKQEKPKEMTWKQFAIEGFFEWNLLQVNAEVYTCSNNKRRLENINPTPRISSVVSKNVFVGGKYTFELETNCFNPGSHTIGVTSKDYKKFSDYIFFSSKGMGVTGAGFWGDGANYCSYKLPIGVSKVQLVVDLENKKMEIFNKESPEAKYVADISKLTNDGVRIGVTITFEGSCIEVKSVSWQ